MMLYQENWNVEQRILNFEIDIVIEIAISFEPYKEYKVIINVR